MQIDRRITNGLAWAGAFLVVGIPAADFLLRQMNDAPPQVSVVQEEKTAQSVAEVPVTPAPAASPAPVAPAAPVAETPVAEEAAPAAKPASTGDAVIDKYLQSGKDLPSYISDGGSVQKPAETKPVEVAKPAAETPKPQQTQAVTPAPTPAPVETAAVPRTKLVTLPTPVSERPPSVATARPVVSEPAPIVAQQPAIAPQQPVIVTPSAQPPLIVSEPEQIITAEDLEDWETGPLSDFLARRSGTSQRTQQFDGNGFFLDQAPGNLRPQRMPDAYDDDYYFPFGQ